MNNTTQKIKLACDLLYDASKTVRILTRLGWSQDVRHQFFRNKCERLPKIEYPKFDPTETHERIAIARKSFDFGQEFDPWLENIANRLDTGAMLLSTTGTPEFFDWSEQLYGAPKTELIDNRNTPLGLATQFDSLFEQFQKLDLGEPNLAESDSTTLAEHMTKAVDQIFGTDAPNVYVVDELSSNAIAGARRIRIRTDAVFTENDIQQLIHHEAHIHVATSLNGSNQPNLKILAAAHPGTTKTQEGLAVFAEFITGSMDLDRFRRLADRVIAIQMAVDGADFIEVYKYFLERTDNPEQSFENARRVFRGGVITGGAPFTKDVVYLDGLLRVHNFFRTAVSSGRADCLRLMFCGKLDIEDFPVLAKLANLGICHPPKYLPPWAKDIRFLLCYLSYSAFLNKIDLVEVKDHYAKIFESLANEHIE